MKKYTILIIIISILTLSIVTANTVYGFGLVSCNIVGQGEEGVLTILSTEPEDGETNVPLDADIRVEFDKLINENTLNENTFLVGNVDLGDIDGELSFQGSIKTVIFKPTNNLMPNKEYIVTVTTDIRGKDGEKLKEEYQFKFTTGSGEAGKVYVDSVSPKGDNIPLDTNIIIKFTNNMNESTLSYIQISSDSGNVPYTLSYNSSNYTATLDPNSNLEYGKEYTVIIPNTVEGAQGENFDGYQFSFTTIYKNIFVSKSGDSSNTGLSPDSPLPTISEGIAAAQINGVSKVYVSEGTYAETVTMVEGISIYGGYSSSNWSNRDPNSYITIISDPSTSGGEDGNPNRAVDIGSGITSNTIIDGFKIVGGGGDYTAGIFCHDGASPTIQNNVLINAGSGTTRSYGIYSSDSSPTIQNNDITGGDGNVVITYSILSINGAPLIQYNNIDGGNATSYTYGINNTTSSSTIQYNTINGGTAGQYSYGIYVSHSSNPAPLIQNNNINGGYGAQDDSYGIIMRWSANGIIINNTIYGGTASYSHGFRIQDSTTTATIRNNTIDSGSGSNAMCIRLQPESGSSVGPTVTIENNIIMSSVNADGIYEWGGTSVITQNNNAFAGCGSGTNTNNGNIVYTNVGELNLVDYSGKDWHLTTNTPVNVRQGGLDGNNEGWGFSTDKDDIHRTNLTEGPNDNPANQNAAGWSMGAYEKD